jgi:uncharacterized glyoxalase superfamily protein PhnB
LSDPADSQSLYPVIRYRDADAAIEWLGRAFGATDRVAYRDDSGAVMHAELDLDGQLIMLGTADPGGWMEGSEPKPLSSTVSLYVAIEDPDARHDRAAGAGATIVRGLEDTNYGSRDFSARDIEGNLWSFGTYRPSASEVEQAG